MEVVASMLGWVLDALAGIFNGLVQLLTYNPLSQVGTPATSGLVTCITFVDRFVPVRVGFRAVGSAVPWFIILIVAGIIWRWVKGL